MLAILLVALVRCGSYLWLLHQQFEASIADLRRQTMATPAGMVSPELPPLVRAYALRAGGTAAGCCAIADETTASIHGTQAARAAGVRRIMPIGGRF